MYALCIRFIVVVLFANLIISTEYVIGLMFGNFQCLLSKIFTGPDFAVGGSGARMDHH